MIKKIVFSGILFFQFCTSSGPLTSSSTLVVVNNRTISKDQFAEQAESIKHTPGIDLASKDGRLSVLKDMINEELVFQAALKDEFHLKNLDLKHEIVKEYLKQTFAKDLPNITDDQVKTFYDQNQGTIDQIRASHILIKPKKDDQASKDEARSKAAGILSDITRGKISFADAAAQYSEDGTKDAGGDLGYFEKSRMVAPFAEAAFALKKTGDISPVIETQFGYHIIQLTEDFRGLEINKEKIRWKIAQSVLAPAVDKYFNNLREHAKIEMKNSDIMSIPVSNQ